MSDIAEKYGIDLYHQHKCQCPKCASKGGDNSKDNFMVYGTDSSGRHKGGYCWSCNFTIPSEEWLEENGNVEIEKEYNLVGSVFNDEIHKQLKETTTTNSMNFRGIKADICALFGVRHKYDTETGDMVAQYYPCTIKNKLSGYKCRELPKKFNAIGTTGKECDLFGQFRFKTSNSKRVLIVGGEIDQLSAFQMIRDYYQSKGGEFEDVPVVSPTIGESGADKQIQGQYEFFSRFEQIIICMDNDEAGQRATDAIVKVLPKGKAFVMSMSLKDPNEYLKSGRQKEFVSCLFSAKPHTPNGIVGSGALLEKMREAAVVPKIPLPPFMHKLEGMMAGGIPLAVIVNIASASGTGKSTIVDECVYHWIFNSPHRIGVVSLESDCAQYGTKMLSRHIGRKIDLICEDDVKIALLESEDVEIAANSLFFTEDGNHRWHLLDERDGGVENLKDQIMQLVVQCDCRVIILDPLTDILDGMSNEEQAVFMRWQKGFVKSHNVTFINISHTRKSSGNDMMQNSRGAELYEESMMGSSSIFKSAACNLLFMRDKEAENEIVRNVTRMKMSKCRWTGITGPQAGEYYYENSTHTVWDLQDYLVNNPEVNARYMQALEED